MSTNNSIRYKTKAIASQTYIYDRCFPRANPVSIGKRQQRIAQNSDFYDDVVFNTNPQNAIHKTIEIIECE